MPLEKSSLRTISKPLAHFKQEQRNAYLINGKVTDEHTPHHVRFWPKRYRLCVMMPVTRELQIPKALSPAFFPKYLDSTLGIPVLRARSTSSHFSFDLDGVVVLLGDPTGHYAIPPIPVASLCHHSSVPLELGVLSVPNLRTPRISIDNELPHLVACHAHTYIGEDLMEVLQLRLAPVLIDDPSVLTKA